MKLEDWEKDDLDVDVPEYDFPTYFSGKEIGKEAESYLKLMEHTGGTTGEVCAESTAEQITDESLKEGKIAQKRTTNENPKDRADKYKQTWLEIKSLPSV